MRWVEDGQKSEHWVMVCFLSQQVAEKSLTCIAVARDARQIKSHSLRELAVALGINGGGTLSAGQASASARADHRVEQPRSPWRPHEGGVPEALLGTLAGLLEKRGGDDAQDRVVRSSAPLPRLLRSLQQYCFVNSIMPC